MIQVKVSARSNDDGVDGNVQASVGLEVAAPKHVNGRDFNNKFVVGKTGRGRPVLPNSVHDLTKPLLEFGSGSDLCLHSDCVWMF